MEGERLLINLLYGKAPSPRSNSYHFGRKRYLFVHLPLKNDAPFRYLQAVYKSSCLFFSTLQIKLIQPYCLFSRLKALLNAINYKFPYPFLYFKKSLPFNMSEAWKRHHLWVESPKYTIRRGIPPGVQWPKI